MWNHILKTNFGSKMRKVVSLQLCRWAN